MILSGLSLLCTVFTLRVKHSSVTKRPPRWLRRFLTRCVANCLGLRCSPRISPAGLSSKQSRSKFSRSRVEDAEQSSVVDASSTAVAVSMYSLSGTKRTQETLSGTSGGRRQIEGFDDRAPRNGVIRHAVKTGKISFLIQQY